GWRSLLRAWGLPRCAPRLPGTRRKRASRSRAPVPAAAGRQRTGARHGCGDGGLSPASREHGTAWIVARNSALDHVHRQAAAAGFLVLVLHVVAGLAHGLDDLVEGDLVGPVAAHGHAA